MTSLNEFVENSWKITYFLSKTLLVYNYFQSKPWQHFKYTRDSSGGSRISVRGKHFREVELAGVLWVERPGPR